MIGELRLGAFARMGGLRLQLKYQCCHAAPWPEYRIWL
jgi:hypothetical protein